MPPYYSNPDAYNLLAREIPHLDTTDGFLRASVAVSMHALDDLDLKRVEEINGYLHELAERVLCRVPSRSIPALLAHLHEVLFEELGFAGDNETMYHPLSSYLPAVCALRRGNPVTLAAVYKIVAVRTGLFVQGVNAPGRFLVRVRGENSWLIVDPFARGRVLSEEEVVALIKFCTEEHSITPDKVFRPATNAQWLSRIISGIEGVLECTDHEEDLWAMNELHALLRDTAEAHPYII